MDGLAQIQRQDSGPPEPLGWAVFDAGGIWWGTFRDRVDAEQWAWPGCDVRALQGERGVGDENDVT